MTATPNTRTVSAGKRIDCSSIEDAWRARKHSKAFERSLCPDVEKALCRIGHSTLLMLVPRKIGDPRHRKLPIQKISIETVLLTVLSGCYTLGAPKFRPGANVKRGVRDGQDSSGY
jgi:hypothetical protein